VFLKQIRLEIRPLVISSFVCLLLAASFAHPANLANSADKINKSESPAHSIGCDAIWSRSIISLADYTDWTLEQSAGTKAGWTVKPDQPDTRRSLTVWFKKSADGLRRSQLIIKSAGLSARKFDTINAMSITLKSGVRGRLRVILQDATGRQFYSKYQFSTGYPDWVEFTGASYAIDALTFHGMRHALERVTTLTPPTPPFSDDIA
jgi:hypothetical protein